MSLTSEEKLSLFNEFKRELEFEFFKLVNDSFNPNCSVFSQKFRNLNAAQWNTKVLGTQLAALMYDTKSISRRAILNNPFVPNWCPTKFDHFLENWFVTACNELQIAPVLHRKVWEEAYLISVIKYFNLLKPGTRGIVFGVGEERLPSYFASKGCKIVATDLDPTNYNADSWVSTNQHGSLDKLFFNQYLTRDVFDSHVSFQYADMNSISDDLEGQFDFCWSTCAYEHLGSIEKGLNFVKNTAKLLKPGGVSVHTTEYNFSSNDKTIDNWPTVLFRQCDFDTLYNDLNTAGLNLPSKNFEIGEHVIDAFIDIPPYKSHDEFYIKSLQPPHLKLLVDGFGATCYGVNFQKPF